MAAPAITGSPSSGTPQVNQPVVSPTPTVTPTPTVSQNASTGSPTPSVSCMTFTTISNTNTGAGGTRQQTWQLNGTPCAGQTVSLGTYGVILTYNVQSGDTIDDVGNALANLVNNTSVSEWNAGGYSNSVNNPNGFPPDGFWNSSNDTLVVDLNYQNQFAFSIVNAPTPTPTPTVAPTPTTGSPSPTPTPSTTGSPTPTPSSAVSQGLTLCITSIQSDAGPDISFYTHPDSASQYNNPFYTITNIQSYTASIQAQGQVCFGVSSGFPSSGTIYSISTNNGTGSVCTLVNSYVMASAPTPTPSVAPTPTTTGSPTPVQTPSPAAVSPTGSPSPTPVTSSPTPTVPTPTVPTPTPTPLNAPTPASGSQGGGSQSPD